MPGSIGELPCAYVRFNASTWCLHMPCAGGVSEPATLVTDLLLALAFALAAASLACQHRGLSTLLTRARGSAAHGRGPACHRSVGLQSRHLLGRSPPAASSTARAACCAPAAAAARFAAAVGLALAGGVGGSPRPSSHSAAAVQRRRPRRRRRRRKPGDAPRWGADALARAADAAAHARAPPPAAMSAAPHARGDPPPTPAARVLVFVGFAPAIAAAAGLAARGAGRRAAARPASATRPPDRRVGIVVLAQAYRARDLAAPLLQRERRIAHHRAVRSPAAGDGVATCTTRARRRRRHAQAHASTGVLGGARGGGDVPGWRPLKPAPVAASSIHRRIATLGDDRARTEHVHPGGGGGRSSRTTTR